MELKTLHDKLLAEMPEGATHVESECRFCSPGQITDTHMEETMSKTYSDEEVQALVTAGVAEATKELSKELEDLKATQTVSEWEAKIALTKEEHDAAVAELQAQLDKAVLEAEASKKANEDLTAYLEGEREREEREAAVEARKEERVKAVADAASFPEEYVTANTERWAAMDDESFESLLADYRSMAAKPAGESNIPATTALQATRESQSNGQAKAAISIIRMRESGVDPRELIK